jgi:hypothetical protein
MWAECYPSENGRVVPLTDRSRDNHGERDATPASDVASEPLRAEAVEDFVDASDREAQMRADPLAASAAACSLKVSHRKLEEPKDLVHGAAPS